MTRGWWRQADAGGRVTNAARVASHSARTRHYGWRRPFHTFSEPAWPLVAARWDRARAWNSERYSGYQARFHLGADQTLTLRCDNAASGAETGYAPYIDLVLPTNGVDGAGFGNAPLNDGLSFVAAT